MMQINEKNYVDKAEAAITRLSKMVNRQGKVIPMVTTSKIRNLLAVYKKNEDLINIGAYVKGSDPACDEAIAKMDRINEFLCQTTDYKSDYETTIQELMGLV